MNDTPGHDHPYYGSSTPSTPPTPPTPPSSGEPSPFATRTEPVQGPPGGPTAAPPRRGRLGFAAAVVAAALLVGGGAGVGGAALWDQAADDGGSTGAVTSPATRVVDQGDTPAAEGSVESVAQTVLPSVVKIDVRGAQEAGSGSGIVLSEDGRILTNNHVVALAEEGGEITVAFDDGTTAPARILGTDPLTDTAVIQAEGVSGLTPATIGQSANLDVGQDVVAIGSPFGLDATVTSGIVSALDRPVNVGSDDQGNSTTYPAIQTDAAINPGNSGGPLVDRTGAVVGINSSIRTASSGSAFGQAESGSIGLGFAIPIDEVMPIVEQMSNGETPTHARLGVSVGDAADQEGATSEGALVSTVNEGSTAAQAGLEEGDVVTRVDDTRITGADSLVATIRSYRPGDTVTLTYLRGGEESTAELSLDSD